MRDLRQPLSISLFEDEIYWTDATRNAVYKRNKFDGREHGLVRRNLNYPMGIAVIHSSRQPYGECQLQKLLQLPYFIVISAISTGLF